MFTHWVRPSEPDSGLSGAPLLILLHGYGSHEQDLAGLAPYLPKQLNIVALRAPTEVYPGGYSWFPIGEPGNPDPITVDPSLELIMSWLRDQVLPQKPSRLGLLGFSQGGAMTIELLRMHPELFQFGLNLSGFAIGGQRDGDTDLRASKPPLFWGYDIADPVIAPSAVARTSEYVPEHFTVTERRYPGIGHSISREELDDIRNFLDSQLSRAAQ